MKKNIIKTIFALSITAISLVSCVNDNDYEIPKFTVPFYTLDFKGEPDGVGVAANIPNTINTNLTSTPVWEIRKFNGNEYIQFSSYNNPENTNDDAWFILPGVEVIPNQKLGLDFKLAQAFPSSTFPLTVSYSIDFDGNPNNINTAVWTQIPFSFPSTRPNYEFLKIKDLTYLNEGNETLKVYFALNYKGAKNSNSTTMIQVDNINLTLN
jgi:hypothetical protein